MTRSPDPTRPVRVLIVDDHQVVHWGLKIMLTRLPWVERCFCANTAAEAIAIAQEQQPDIAVVDLFVGDESGPQICERLHLARRGLRVLLISGAGQISPAAAAACGADGFVAKDAPGIDMVRAVRSVALGMSAFSGEPADGPARPGLSERERQVLVLVAVGKTNIEIARALHLSPHTVKEYVSAVYRKLAVRNRAEAVQRAVSLGLAA
jgi:DNA-binding NarL/FixJ family response regulator